MTLEDRKMLEDIASREDRDLGYIATWFLRWGMDQYRSLGGSLVTMRTIQLVSDEKAVDRQAVIRLRLREEAHAKYDQATSESHREAKEKKRA
jgi:hypothetical protein